ncbi:MULTISPECIES: type ISP restriction/modification enzyme [unclassified Streptomyces]|uniref:type ISP restriction/modification enzyme n=1 Tax=unclassified Streptomyces TaxID=2593676 RepID=UPI0013A6F127|nr:MULTISPECIES: type ISP restriction/modification enzyme [unclassified Streptomyces]
MPWSVSPLRLGRAWVAAPDPATLRARWAALAAAGGPERERLFRPTRARTPAAGAASLPGQRAGSTARFSDTPGPCPEPVRVLREPFDEQWLLPDQRLIDQARPELWRVLDEHQLFLVELPKATQYPKASPHSKASPHPKAPRNPQGGRPDPELLVTAHLPVGRLGRIRPLHRRPGGAEPNLAPGLLPLLGERYGTWVTPEDVLCWILAAGRPGPRGYEVPLAPDAARWRAGLELGHRLLSVRLRGARGGEPPRLPGGRRPYVRSALPAWPRELSYDPESETLGIGTGTVSPVPAGAWEYEVQGVRVLEAWFGARLAHRDPEADGLEALGPAEWPQGWTSELLTLVTTLALLADLAPARAAFEPGPNPDATASGPDPTTTGPNPNPDPTTTGPDPDATASGPDPDPAAPDATAPNSADLRAAGVLPPPRWARRPASVLDHQEEGPGGQFALL